jgi:hypothetical protein
MNLATQAELARWEQDADLAHWQLVGRLMRALGATDVALVGDGLRASFTGLTVHGNIYESNRVAAYKGPLSFVLSSGITEPRAFSVEIYATDTLLPHLVALTFGPLPEARSGIDARELAHRFALVLRWLLDENRVKMLDPQRRLENPLAVLS